MALQSKSTANDRAEHYAFFALSFLNQPDRKAMRQFLSVLSEACPDGVQPASAAFIDALAQTLNIVEVGLQEK